ncbi:apyrase [Plutella xylostella]|uniref:apyrase n=1 Tax=Plutella xylostella TaxID=51655 RepID=UPI0020326AE2|nr:apyrase [Plutella xylostella]
MYIHKIVHKNCLFICAVYFFKMTCEHFVTVKSVVCISVLCFFLNKSFVSSFVLKKIEPFRLDIIHYNDFHDRFEETSVDYPLCSTNDSRCLGGFARLYHEVMALKRTRPDALLLNAGDSFQGTYWYTLLKWNVTQHFINMLPNDAHALGNHEFDDHVSGLVPYISALRAPVLAANMDASREPRLQGLAQAHTVLERGGRSVGVIGLITTETAYSSSPDGVVFLDPVNTTKFYAEKLTREGIDIIILLSHCGLIVDKKIAKEAGEHIDVIVGGHSHSLLWSGTPPSPELAQGPYPVVVAPDSAPGHKVVIVQASAYSKYLGNLTVFFDDEGEVQHFEGTPVFLNRSIPEDPSIKALMQPYSDKLHSIVGEVVGYSPHDLSSASCDSGECAVGNLVADSYLDAAKSKNISNLPHVAFITKSNLRGSVSKGDITRGDLITTLPFSNQIVTLALKGKYLVQAFEKSFLHTWSEDPFASPSLTQVSGVQLTLSVKQLKAVKVLVREGDEFVPLDPEREYQLTVTDFVAKGGHYSMISEHGRDARSIGLDREMLENYVKKITPNMPTLENRLTIIP